MMFKPAQDLTIYHVAALKQQLEQYLAQSPSDMILDLSAVQDMDSAGLQFVLLTQQEAKRRQLRHALHQPTVAIKQQLAFLRLTPVFTFEE